MDRYDSNNRSDSCSFESYATTALIYWLLILANSRIVQCSNFTEILTTEDCSGINFTEIC